MRADKHGITLNRHELALIIAFTSEASGFNVGHFRTTSSGKLHVAASDGKRAIEGVAKSEGAVVGEWRISREWLEQCRRACDEGETQIRLVVTEKGCKRAVLVAIQDGDERNELVNKKDDTSTQTTMKEVLDVARCKRNLDAGSWFALHPQHVKELAVVSAACDKCPVTFYPPGEPNAELCFEASGEGGRWGGVIKTTPVVAPGDSAVDKDDAEDDERPGEELPAGLRLEPTLATAKKNKKPKASKARSKKRRPASNGAAHDTEPPATSRSTEEQPQA